LPASAPALRRSRRRQALRLLDNGGRGGNLGLIARLGLGRPIGRAGRNRRCRGDARRGNGRLAAWCGLGAALEQAQTLLELPVAVLQFLVLAGELPQPVLQLLDAVVDLLQRIAHRPDEIDDGLLALVQIAFTALLSCIAMPIAREPFVMPPLPVWGSALFMGVVATAFALAVMNRVQQFVSSTQATLIYALELVWVGMLGYVAGDQLSLYGWIGCGFILLGMVTGELRLTRLFKRVEATGPFLC